MRACCARSRRAIRVARRSYSTAGEFHIIFIRNDGILYHYLRTGTGEPDQKLVSQPSSLIDIKPRGTNSLRIVALEDKGWVFINDTYVTTLDLEGISEAGNVQAINGYFKGDGIEGGVTRYEGLTVRRLQTSYGPVDGALAHNDDGFIEEHDSNVEIADAVIEARFFNPYSRAVGQWDYGFIFRGSSVNTFLAVIVTDDGKWQHKVRTGTVESSVLLDSGESSAINTSSNGSNYIRLIVLGDDAWFFINEIFVAKLDLSSLSTSGDVSAITGFFTGDVVAGQITNFHSFTVSAFE